MLIIGKNTTDSKYSISMAGPTRIYSSSELIPFNVTVSVPCDASSDVSEIKCMISLYASNSKSSPAPSKQTYWSSLTPTWRFYNSDKKPITNLEIKGFELKNDGSASKTETFYFSDDSSTDVGKPVYIWATLDTSDTLYAVEAKKYNTETYSYPSYSNSKIISILKIEINPSRTVEIVSRRNYYEPMSNGIYWESQKIPMMMCAVSDHLSAFDNNISTIENNISYEFPYIKSSIPLNASAFIAVSGNTSAYASGDNYAILPASSIDIDTQWLFAGNLSGYNISNDSISENPDFKIVDNMSTDTYGFKSGGYTMAVTKIDDFSGFPKIISISGYAEYDGTFSNNYKSYTYALSDEDNSLYIFHNKQFIDNQDYEDHVKQFLNIDDIPFSQDEKQTPYIEKITGTDTNGLFALDPINNMWTLSIDTSSLIKYNSSGKKILEIPCNCDISNADTIDIDSENNIYLSTRGPSGVLKFDGLTGGEPLKYYSQSVGPISIFNDDSICIINEYTEEN